MVAIRRRTLAALLGAILLLTIYRLTDDSAARFASPLPVPKSGSSHDDGSLSKASTPPTIQDRPRFPVSSFLALPTGQPLPIPRIQHKFKPENADVKRTREKRRTAVKAAFTRSWQAYKKHAWLKDELAPLTGGYRTTFGGWAATLVDTLDTLWIMDMKEEFDEAVAAVADIDFRKPEQLPLNVFETTIRYLGGLLGAYDISGGRYPVLLSKAVEVGKMLYPAFDTPNRMPVTQWSMSGDQSALPGTPIADLGSLSLEFTRLSQLSGDPSFYDAIQRIANVLDEQQNQTKLPGMWPVLVNAEGPTLTEDSTFSLGALSDSVYEYLPKEYLLLGGLSNQYRKLYEDAMNPITQLLLFKPMTTTKEDILLSGNVKVGEGPQFVLDPYSQHLACFVGGMVALGAKIFDRHEELATARKLVDGCIWAYESMPTGIMPEIFNAVPCPQDATENCTWDQERWAADMFARNSYDDQDSDKLLSHEDLTHRKSQRLRLPPGFSAMADRRYILRPEAIESIFVLYRITGDEALRDDAWTMFKAITHQTRTDIAYAAIDDVTWKEAPQSDRMESFWLAETLKYFYLLYSEPELVSLDEYVLNTEAHPLQRPK